MGRHVKYNGQSVYVSNNLNNAIQSLQQQGYSPQQVNEILGLKNNLPPPSGYSHSLTRPINYVDAQGNKVIYTNSSQETQQVQQNLLQQGFNPSGSTSARQSMDEAQGELKQGIKNNVEYEQYKQALGKQLQQEIIQDVKQRKELIKQQEQQQAINDNIIKNSFSTVRTPEILQNQYQQIQNENKSRAIQITQELRGQESQVPEQYKTKLNYVVSNKIEKPILNSTQKEFLIPEKGMDNFFQRGSTYYENKIIGIENEFTQPEGVFKLKPGTSTKEEMKINQQIKPIDFSTTIKTTVAVGGLFAFKRVEGIKDLVFHLPSTLYGVVTFPVVAFQNPKSIIEQFNTPTKAVGSIGYMSGQVSILKKVAKIVPKKEVKVKASEFDILKVRRVGKDGKMFTETQIRFTDVTYGKPTLRWFWQPKTKVPKSVIFKGTQTTTQLYTDYGYTKSEGTVIGKLEIQGNKIKPDKIDVTEIGKPESVIDTSVSQGTTRINNPIQGQTPKLPNKFDVKRYIEQRKAYTQNRITKTDIQVYTEKGRIVPDKQIPVEGVELNAKLPKNTLGQYYPGTFKIKLKKGQSPFGGIGMHEGWHHISDTRNFFGKLSKNKKALKEFNKIMKDKDITDVAYPEGKYKSYPSVKETPVNVPERIKVKTEVSSSRLYSNIGKKKGTLLAEIKGTGKIVKRKYEKKNIFEPEDKIIQKRGGSDVNTIFERTKATENLFEQQPIQKSRQQVITETVMETQKSIGKKQLKSIGKKQLKSIIAVESKPIFKTPKVFNPQTEKPNLLGENTNSMMFRQIGQTKSSNIFNTAYKSNSRFDNITKSFQTQNFKPNQKLKSIQRVNQLPTQKTVVGVQTKQRQEQKTGQVTRTIQQQKPITTTKTKIGFEEITVTTPKVVPFLLGIQTTTKGKQAKEQGYNVYMKEYKKKVKANDKPLSREEATRLGMDIADNSLSASFIVSKTHSKVPSAQRKGLGGNPFIGKFTASNRRKGWFNEKRTNRLDTFGERQGITASKLIAQRRVSTGNMFRSFKQNNKNIFGR
jgi:hypothetical protein